MQHTYSHIAENIIERGVALARQGQLSTTNSRANLLDRTVQMIRQDTENMPTLIERETRLTTFASYSIAARRIGHEQQNFLALTVSRYGAN